MPRPEDPRTTYAAACGGALNLLGFDGKVVRIGPLRVWPVLFVE